MADIFDQAGQQYNVDPNLLRAQMQVESGGNNQAVSPQNAQGAMQIIPATAKALGVTNPFDRTQAVMGAAKLMSENLDRYQDPVKAVMAYHGGTDQANWGPKTQAYAQKVSAAYQSQGQNMPQEMPGLPPTAQASSAGNDPFSALLAKAGSAPAPATATAQGAAPAGDPFSALMAKAGTDAAKPAKPAAPDLKVSDYMGGAVEPILTGLTSIPAGVLGGATRLASAVLGNTYEGAKQAGENVSNALTYQPKTQGGQMSEAGIGRAASSVKDAVMNSAAGPVISGIGDAYNKNFVQNQNPLMATINSQVPSVIANAALPEAGKALTSAFDGGVVNNLRRAVTGEVPAGPLPDSIPAGTSVSGSARVQAAADAQAQAAAQATAAKPNFRPNGDGTFTPSPKTVPPQAAPAPTAAPATPTPVQTFTAPDLPTPKTVLSADAQAQNIATMKAIGLDSQRQSAIGGDKFTAGQEAQNAKLITPTGEVFRDQLATEQNAIKGFAQGIIKDTGATAAAPEATGQAIRAPLQGLSDHYDAATKQLYTAADKRAGGLPIVQPDALGNLLATNSVFAGKAENSALRRGINAYAKEQGMVGPEGNLQPVTVQTAEGMRQYLNSQWSPQNSGLIGKIKEALDTDVTKAGGDDIYGSARALHAERKNTLDNPNGISSLLNESGPGGINQVVPDEKVANKVLTMPTGQLSHIVDTLNALPESLAPQGQQAIAEMKGALAKQIYKAGDSGGTQAGASVWNAANVTRELNAQRSKMGLLFSPEEIAKFQTLNDAGHIIQAPGTYPGAAAQGHNMLQRGMIMAPPALGATVGHAIGGIPGLSIGSSLGTAMSVKLANRVEMANANKLKAIMANPQVIQRK